MLLSVIKSLDHSNNGDLTPSQRVNQFNRQFLPPPFFFFVIFVVESYVSLAESEAKPLSVLWELSLISVSSHLCLNTSPFLLLKEPEQQPSPLVIIYNLSATKSMLYRNSALHRLNFCWQICQSCL